MAETQDNTWDEEWDVHRDIEMRDLLVAMLRLYENEISAEVGQWILNKFTPAEASALSLKESDGVEIVREVAMALSESAIVYWDQEVFIAAGHQGEESFKGATFDKSILGTLTKDQPHWWTTNGIFQVAPGFRRYFGLGDNWFMHGILLWLRETGDEWELNGFCLLGPHRLDNDPDGSDLLRLRALRIADSTGDVDHPLLLAHLAFLNLPFVSVAKHQFPRAERRRAEREQRQLPDVKVVLLRRPEQSESTHTQQGREWHHQWIVRGHWRRQWYPRAETHKPVYVSPYMKGDPAKPLLSRPTVYKVVR